MKQVKSHVHAEQQEEFEAWEKQQGFKVLGVNTFQGLKEYKQVHLQDAKGNQHTALMFQSNQLYDKMQPDTYFDEIVIKQNRKGYIVEEYRSWRNYKNLPEPTTFYFPDGQVLKNF